MYLTPWKLWAVGIGFAWLVRALWRASRRVRCLRYCYIEISDQYVGVLDELLDSPESSIEGIRSQLSRYKKEWGARIDEHAAMMRRADVPPFDKASHARYALEDMDDPRWVQPANWRK